MAGKQRPRYADSYGRRSRNVLIYTEFQFEYGRLISI
jgi:hypothetical protein